MECHGVPGLLVNIEEGPRRAKKEQQPPRSLKRKYDETSSMSILAEKGGDPIYTAKGDCIWGGLKTCEGIVYEKKETPGVSDYMYLHSHAPHNANLHQTSYKLFHSEGEDLEAQRDGFVIAVRDIIIGKLVENGEKKCKGFQDLISINWDVFNVTLSRAIVDLTRQRESIARKKAQAAAHPEDQSSHEPPNFYSRVVEANPYKPNVKARTS